MLESRRFCKCTLSSRTKATQRIPSHLISNRWSFESKGLSAVSASIGFMCSGTMSVKWTPMAINWGGDFDAVPLRATGIIQALPLTREKGQKSHRDKTDYKGR